MNIVFNNNYLQINRLPPELIQETCQYLDKQGLTALNLTCKTVNAISRLEIFKRGIQLAKGRGRKLTFQKLDNLLRKIFLHPRVREATNKKAFLRKFLQVSDKTQQERFLNHHVSQDSQKNVNQFFSIEEVIDAVPGTMNTLTLVPSDPKLLKMKKFFNNETVMSTWINAKSTIGNLIMGEYFGDGLETWLTEDKIFSFYHNKTIQRLTLEGKSVSTWLFKLSNIFLSTLFGKHIKQLELHSPQHITLFPMNPYVDNLVLSGRKNFVGMENMLNLLAKFPNVQQLTFQNAEFLFSDESCSDFSKRVLHQFPQLTDVKFQLFNGALNRVEMTELCRLLSERENPIQVSVVSKDKRSLSKMMEIAEKFDHFVSVQKDQGSEDYHFQYRLSFSGHLHHATAMDWEATNSSDLSKETKKRKRPESGS